MGRERAHSWRSSSRCGCCRSKRWDDKRPNRKGRWKDKVLKAEVVRDSGGSTRNHERATSGERFQRDRKSKGNSITTIFIDNIDRGVSEYHLGKIVRRFARWSRLYISRKRRSWNRNACAFVDVNHIEDAKKVIDGIRGWNINRNSLWARMEFQGHRVKDQRDDHASRAPKANKFISLVQKEKSSAKSRLSIKVRADKGMKACLSKCAVTILQEDKNPRDAMEFLLNRWPNISGLLALSRRKFVMLFNSTHEAKEIVNQTHSNDQILEGLVVRQWTRDDQVEKRRTWVVIRGIPLHAWNKANVRKIAQTVGEVIKIEDEENQFVENAEVRIHVETSTLQMINLKISVQVEEQSFSVAIVEVGEGSVSHKCVDPTQSIIQVPGETGVGSDGQLSLKNADCLQKEEEEKSSSHTASHSGGDPWSTTKNDITSVVLGESPDIMCGMVNKQAPGELRKTHINLFPIQDDNAAPLCSMESVPHVENIGTENSVIADSTHHTDIDTRLQEGELFLSTPETDLDFETGAPQEEIIKKTEVGLVLEEIGI